MFRCISLPALFMFFVLTPIQANAYDVSSTQHAMFKGVERVFILTEFSMSRINSDELPQPLQPKNL